VRSTCNTTGCAAVFDGTLIVLAVLILLLLCRRTTAKNVTS